MKKRSDLLKLNPGRLIDGDILLRERMKDSAFKRAWNEEELKFKIAKAVCLKRKAKRWSQTVLAKKAHTTQKVISRIEHSEVAVGVDLLQRIATALDLKVTISLR